MAGTLVDSNILQTSVAMGLNALREHIALARIVNRDYEKDIQGAKIGDTVKVAVPAAITTISVSANVVPPAVTAVTPTSVSVTVDQWNMAPFAMDDKAYTQLDRGIVPMQLSEAAKSLANTIDLFLWNRLDSSAGIYGFTGTAGTTPFGTSLVEFYDATQIADDQLMPVDNRWMLINAKAKANALGLGEVQSAANRGGGDHFVRGQIGEVGGANWAMSQSVPQHSEANSPTGWLVNDGSVSVGDTTLTINTGSGDPAAGDIFSVAGSDQTYEVQSSTSTVITMRPSIQFAYDNAAVVTFKGDYRMNALIHRDCIAFAMAPLDSGPFSSNSAIAIDEESGLALRLKVTEQHYQTQWAFDALYGASVIRPELGVFVAG